MARKIQYLCNMEIMLKKFCKKYKLPEKSLFELLSHMEEISFSKELSSRRENGILDFYLIKKGIWRAYSPGRRNRKFLMVCHSRRCRIFFMGVCGRQTFSGQYRVCKRQYSLLHQQNQIRGSVCTLYRNGKLRQKDF